MSDEQKQALAVGREQSRKVKAYLDALDAQTSQSRRGRTRSPESIRVRLEAIEAMLPEASTLKRLTLLQERRDLAAALEELESDDAPDLVELEEGFTAAAKPYAERKGITYATFRKVGVPAALLKSAGIPRST